VSGRSQATPQAALDRFIEALGSGATVSEACDEVGIGRRTAYDHRQRDEQFALRWADAIERGTEELETEAKRRAMDGSDTLLMFLLKARRPETYRERTEIRHAGGPDRGPVSWPVMRALQERAAGDPEFRASLEEMARVAAEAERAREEAT